MDEGALDRAREAVADVMLDRSLGLEFHIHGDLEAFQTAMVLAVAKALNPRTPPAHR